MRATVGVSLVLLACAIASMAVAQNNSATVSSGRQLFESFQCWQCHGYEGQGGVGPRIAGTVYPFEAFSRLVRHTTLMPAYSPNVLSDDELRTIWEFMRAQPEPPALDDIPEMGAR